jgi:hypothetical protein
MRWRKPRLVRELEVIHFDPASDILLLRFDQPLGREEVDRIKWCVCEVLKLDANRVMVIDSGGKVSVLRRWKS